MYIKKYYVLPLMIWFAAAFVALNLVKSQLFIGFDGTYMQDLARRQFEWNVPLLNGSIDLFQGIGDVFFFGINFTLLPSYIVGSWFGPNAYAKVAIYLITLVEFTLSIIIFSRSINIDCNKSVFSALLINILVFPFYKTGAIYGIAALVPHFITFMSTSLLISSCFLHFGRSENKGNAIYGIFFIFIIFWFVHASGVVLLLASPFLIICFLCGLWASDDWRERTFKIALLAISVIIFSLPIFYILGLILNTVPVAVPGELLNDRNSLQDASILFHWGRPEPVGPYLVIFAVLGAILTLGDKSNKLLRAFSFTLLSYLATRLSFWFLTVTFDFWRGPSALYFEFFVYPLYAIFSVIFLSKVLAKLFKFAKNAHGLPPEKWSSLKYGY